MKRNEAGVCLDFYTSAAQDRSLGFGCVDGRGRRKKDPPIVRDLLLSLEDCYHGAIKKIKISRRVRSAMEKLY
jgi:DnaJ family protein B protein 13